MTIYRSLGAKHDGNENSCRAYDHYIMEATSSAQSGGKARNPWRFSSCSMNEMSNLLKTTLDSELGDWTRLGVLHTESVPQELWGGKLDYPKSISKVNFCFACQGIFE